MLLEASKIVINILEQKGTVTTVTTVTNWIQTLPHGNLPGHSNVLTAAATAPLPLCLRVKAIQIPSSIYCGISLVKTWNVILHAPTSWKFANNVAGQVPQHSAASIQHRHDVSMDKCISGITCENNTYQYLICLIPHQTVPIYKSIFFNRRHSLVTRLVFKKPEIYKFNCIKIS